MISKFIDYLHHDEALDRYPWLKSCNADWEFWGTYCMQLWKMPDEQVANVCGHNNEDLLEEHGCTFVTDWDDYHG